MHGKLRCGKNNLRPFFSEEHIQRMVSPGSQLDTLRVPAMKGAEVSSDEMVILQKQRLQV